MNGCMETGKPLISILMAVYEPRMDWLREQLLSLNAQTYPNLRLYVCDDCSPTVSYEEIRSCVQDCISAFPYSIERNAQNLGSNGTFERLTREAEGVFFAYCDQDDVWLPEKLEVLEREAETAAMVYCDMSVIGKSGKIIAMSLREIRPRLRYLNGENLAERYFFRNCTAGCSMLVRAKYAKKSIPFPQMTICDQWVAIVAAASGSVKFVDKQLQLYRQHENNQTGVLIGITNRESYRKRKVEPLKERLVAYQKIAVPSAALVEFVCAREAENLKGIYLNRTFSPYEAAFEIAMHFLPDWAVGKWLRRLK